MSERPAPKDFSGSAKFFLPKSIDTAEKTRHFSPKQKKLQSRIPSL